MATRLSSVHPPTPTLALFSLGSSLPPPDHNCLDRSAYLSLDWCHKSLSFHFTAHNNLSLIFLRVWYQYLSLTTINLPSYIFGSVSQVRAGDDIRHPDTHIYMGRFPEDWENGHFVSLRVNKFYGPPSGVSWVFMIQITQNNCEIKSSSSVLGERGLYFFLFLRTRNCHIPRPRETKPLCVYLDVWCHCQPSLVVMKPVLFAHSPFSDRLDLTLKKGSVVEFNTFSCDSLSLTKPDNEKGGLGGGFITFPCTKLIYL